MQAIKSTKITYSKIPEKSQMLKVVNTNNSIENYSTVFKDPFNDNYIVTNVLNSYAGTCYYNIICLAESINPSAIRLFDILKILNDIKNDTGETVYVTIKCDKMSDFIDLIKDDEYSIYEFPNDSAFMVISEKYTDTIFIFASEGSIIGGE